MRLERIDVLRLELSFQTPIGTAVGTHVRRPVLLVRLVTDAGVGWGECGALADGTSVDPSIDQVAATLADRAIPQFLRATAVRSGELPESSQVAALFGSERSQRMAGAALEMAVLDAELMSSDVSLSKRFGTSGSSEVGALVGIPASRTLVDLLDEVAAAVARGFRRVRLKIEPGWDLWPVQAVREAHPDLLLQVDANGSYVLDTDRDNGAHRLLALDGFDLRCIEQPFAATDLASHALLAERLATPICLDESLGSVRNLQDALRYGACKVACVKPARMGGLFAAQRAQALCREFGVDAFVGGLFETGLGRSANVALSGLSGFTLPGDLSAPSDYLDADPFGYSAVVDGLVEISHGPGVGPRPRAEILEAHATLAATFDARE